MPAAAVIPAPTAYINVVAVKMLVVEVMVRSFLELPFWFTLVGLFLLRRAVSFAVSVYIASLLCAFGQRITVKKLECSKQMYI